MSNTRVREAEVWRAGSIEVCYCIFKRLVQEQGLAIKTS